MKHHLKICVNRIGSFTRPTTRKRLKPLLAILVLFALASQLKAQCFCTPIYELGTGAAVPYASLSAALVDFPGIDNPAAGCIMINGQFDVDATWNLNGNNIRFATSGSSLFVLSNGVLHAEKTKFAPCGDGFSEWLGIYVQEGGTISTDYCEIEQAAHAGISIAGNANFYLTNTVFSLCNKGLYIVGTQTPGNHLISEDHFYNCNFGIYTVNATDVTILHNFYKRTNLSTLHFPNVYMTGIYLESKSENISIQGGDFIGDENRYLILGISALKSKNVDISDVNFINSRSGIYSYQGSRKLVIQRCTLTNIPLKSIEISQHDTEAGNDGGILVKDNVVNNVLPNLKPGRTNFLVENLYGFGKVEILNNTIELATATVAGGPSAVGIQVEHIFADEGLFINSNKLNYPGPDVSTSPAPAGIFVGNSRTDCSINDNIVSYSGTAPVAMPYHITASDCTYTLNLQGNDIGGGSVLNALKGISIENCPATLTLCCNELTNSNTGLYITGALNGAQIFTTTFGAHPVVALHYFQVTSTGALQMNRGNDWSHASGALDARFDGSTGVATATKYTVSNSYLPNGFTKIRVNGSMFDAPIWFAINAAAEPTCSAVCTGVGNAAPGGGNERDAAADSSPAFNPFVYPNPADQLLTVEFPLNDVQTLVVLRDATGRTVLQQQAPEGTKNVQLSTATLPQGLYFLELKQNGRPDLRSKVIVSHN